MPRAVSTFMRFRFCQLQMTNKVSSQGDYNQNVLRYQMCFINRHTKSFFLGLTKGNDDDEKYE